MDRFASNTLRTLAIVAISIVVIIGSLALLLLALCFSLIGVPILWNGMGASETATETATLCDVLHYPCVLW